jgi:hypothetical protein
MSAVTTYPDVFNCPITLTMMTDPVTAEDGHTYERAAIMQCLRHGHGISPMTRVTISSVGLRPNYAIKSQIEEWKSKNNGVAVVASVPPFKDSPNTYTALIKNSRMYFKITPPETGARQPAVIFIILDNSGSMATAACNITETGGKLFTRMDLCKHTIRAIAGMLAPTDLMSIITFSDCAKMVIKPTLMTDDAKLQVERVLANIHPESSTNMWAGLELANKHANLPEFKNCNIFGALLTDGTSNIDPPRGIVESYKRLEKSMVLSTFGFGYELDSKILSNLAKEGNGSFGFIPDYSMVATVFINWVATSLSTSSLNNKINIKYGDGSTSVINIGSIQFGQCIDKSVKIDKPIIEVDINGNGLMPVIVDSIDEINLCRDDIIEAITGCIDNDGTVQIFDIIYNRYKTSTNPLVQELIKDIKPSGDDEGQISMAPKYYHKWGKHYMRAYLLAQVKQQCMNFKDPGLQIYGGAMFKKLQSIGEDIFCKLPPLVASGEVYRAPVALSGGGASGGAGAAPAPVPSMAQVFYNSGGGCFAGESKVLMNDYTDKKIMDINPGDYVWTPFGSAKVIALVTCGSYEKQKMCNVNGLFITPWHPIKMNIESEWVFPNDLRQSVEHDINTVYNLVLDKEHIVSINSILCVTLGHDIHEEIVEHEYFGSQKVIEDLKKCEGWDIGRPTYKNLVSIKDPITNKVIGWMDKV